MIIMLLMCFPTLTIAEVGVKINLKDDDAIKKWLIANGITIQKSGKFRFVFEIDVDCVIDKMKVLELKRQYPNDWIDLYKTICKDNAVYEMVVRELGGKTIRKPATKLNLSKSENQLYSKYANE
ncbi:hypothetical protein [Flavobacterium anhuiense]|uniref:hypothetical protein n=1 Tax=Flavobacterium anhuiense TaxID=459526 RepID=UPI0013C52070|nr:hypothetical protein [Flavobacterium anhuiense]